MQIQLSSEITSPYSTMSVIGRVKRAPHWAVHSRFRVIYICMSTIVYVKTYNAKMRGQNYVVQTRTCSKSVLGV